MKTSYQIVSTWDSYRCGYFGECESLGRAHIAEGALFGSQILLPNAPIPARNTLLAQCLRAGLTTEDRENLRQSWSYQHFVQANRTGRMERKVRVPVSVFHRPELLGKLLGVEIEFYPKDSRNAVNQLTNWHGDGSLDDGGRELVRLTWANAEGRLAGLLKLNLRGHVDRKCGLHVHVDVRHLPRKADEPHPELLSAEETYDKLCEFYPHLKKLVPRSRLRNNYCRWRNNRPGAQKCRLDERYAAINWWSHEEHGTFEFRCQGGSLNIVKIETWALLCQFLVRYAAQRHTKVPKTWDKFLTILPEPFRSWCILRREKLYGSPVIFDDRTKSAVE